MCVLWRPAQQCDVQNEPQSARGSRNVRKENLCDFGGPSTSLIYLLDQVGENKIVEG